MGKTSRFRVLLAVVMAVFAGACSADAPTGRGMRNNPSFAAGGSGGAGGVSGVGGASGSGPAGGVGGGMEIPPPDGTPFMRDDTAMSGLDTATIDALRQGGASCTTEVLYPYDGTVFPSGIISPLFQWKAKADAAYVHVGYDGSPLVKYEFATAASDPGELRIPQDAWNEIGRRATNKALIVKLSVQAGGAISTCERRLGMAPGVMKGVVYYNTYAAPNAKNYGQGAVMRTTIGLEDAHIYQQYNGTEVVMSGTGPCISCHTVSANGTTMIASLHNYAVDYGGGAWGGGGGGGGKVFKALVYPVIGQPEPASTGELPNAEFSAIYPDGSRVLTMGNPQCTGGAETGPRAPNNFPLVVGPDVAKVLDVKTGADLHAAGLDPNFYMWMPQFSPDGKHVVFNHAKPDGKGGSDRRELAMMDYDYATNTFSKLRVLVSHLGPEPSLPYMPAPAGAGPTGPGNGGCMPPAGQSDVGAINPGTCTGPCYPAFPFFTPDGKGVVFSLTSEPDFMSGFPGRDEPAKADLWYVDVATGESVRLDRANASLDPEDEDSNYFPTMLPVQVGGYFWAFWTSRRSWGHKLDSGATVVAIPGFPTGISIPGGLDATKKRIWVTAIRPGVGDGDVSAGLTDPSAPGFYLEGQSESGNVRAFATLAPCVAAGTACTSGLDCCDGICKIENGAAEGVCSAEPPMCSHTNDKCSVDTDCCPPEEGQPANVCIGGYCGFVLVVE